MWRGPRTIEHVGSAHDDKEWEALKVESARQGRSVFETIRLDPSELFLGIRTNVWMAFAAIAIGVVVWIVQTRRHPGLDVCTPHQHDKPLGHRRHDPAERRQPLPDQGQPLVGRRPGGAVVAVQTAACAGESPERRRRDRRRSLEPWG